MRDARQERIRRAEERKVLAWIAEQPPGSTVKDLVDRTGISSRTVRSVLKDLRGRGKIERMKMRKRIEGLSEKRYRASGSLDGSIVTAAIINEYRYYLRTRTTRVS